MIQNIYQKFQKNKQIFFLLLAIFVLALVCRFLYFPGDIYFAYDQARDAFISLKIMSRDLKVVGPPATFKDVYHGALFYYPFGLIYYISQGSPIPLAALLRIYNALGVFIIFFIAHILFNNKRTGFVASILYAFSFEQTQYSLFLGHPALAVIWV